MRYLITLQVSRNCLSPFKSIVIQKHGGCLRKVIAPLLTTLGIMPFAFKEQHSAVFAHFTGKQKLPFAIQEYSDPETWWMS